MTVNTNYGALPEAAALSAAWASEPDWSSAHKLSGFAAMKASLKFDKDGKVFASGEPAFGAILEGVWAYDPRLDSTYPGGSGSCRLDDEETWPYTENPALHAASYAFGRTRNDRKVFGGHIRSIDWAAVVDWANVCDANNWTSAGLIFEPGDKPENLRRICRAGGARFTFTGGTLTFIYEAPLVIADTITIDDLADGDFEIPGMTPYAERLNTVVPLFRSPERSREIQKRASPETR
jgi:hypothetical protein